MIMNSVGIVDFKFLKFVEIYDIDLSLEELEKSIRRFCRIYRAQRM